MKESRFIELLNLYVDQQISPQEAAELETEVMRQPARRRLYRQYCQIQRACALLGDQARENAPASFALEVALMEADQKTAASSAPSRSRSLRWIPTGATVAAAAMAACVVFVFMRSDPAASPGSVTATKNSVVAPMAVAAVVDAEPVAPGALSVSRRAFPIVLGSGLAFNDATEADNVISAADKPALEWIAGVQLAPLQRVPIEELEFETRPTLRSEAASFSSRRKLNSGGAADVELVSFQFQR